MSVVGISTTYSTDMMCFLLFLILKASFKSVIYFSYRSTKESLIGAWG